MDLVEVVTLPSLQMIAWQTHSLILTAFTSQVSQDCGFLPLALAIAGSMPLVADAPWSPDAWHKLHEILKDEAGLAQNKNAQEGFLRVVMTVSFKEMDRLQQSALLALAVLPNDVVAPIEMLCYLWDKASTSTIFGQL